MPNDFDLFIRRDFDPAAERHAGFSNSLLCRAVAAYGIPRERAEALCLLRTEKGKPFFKDSDIYFNISHSRNIWACLVGRSCCGLDIQYIRPCGYKKIAGRFFSETEQQYVSEKGIDGFFDIWVRREAYGKFTGEGFFGECPDFIRNGKPVGELPGGVVMVPVDLREIGEDIKCAVCTEGPVSVLNIREDW